MDGRERRALTTLAAVSCVSIIVGCAVPESKPLVAADVANRVADRAGSSSELLDDALALFDVPPLGLDLTASEDADRDAFWHAHALAFHPDIRAARRTWRSQRASVEARGVPGPVEISASVDDFSDTSRQQDIAATVDLLGLLGLGVTPAERDEAVLLVDAALGELEDVAWRAVFGVDAARTELAAANLRASALSAVLLEARRDLSRLTLLDEHGRLPPGALGRAQATVAELDTQLSLLTVDALDARRRLAIGTGLPTDAEALARASSQSLCATPLDTNAVFASTDELFDRLPALRRAVRDYALAEARVRTAAASAWPTLRLGPGVKILPDETLTGGVISFDIPWPSAVEARMSGALEERAAAREVVEDRLVETLAEIDTRAAELRIAHDVRERDVTPMLAGSERTWRAARANLSIRDDLDTVETWTDALRLRARAVVMDVDAIERVMLADLARREAAGLPPGLAPTSPRNGRAP